MIFNPLEPFEVNIIRSFDILGVDLSITSTTIGVLVTAIVMCSLLLFASYRSHIVPRFWQTLVEMLYQFILDIIKQQTGIKGIVYFPILLYTFLFLLTANLAGLMPYGFAVTGHIIVTWFLSFSFNIAFFIHAVRLQGIKFILNFVPKGVPFVLLPLVFVIEVMSYNLRMISLAVRLFANMMAGHILLFTISTFATKFLAGSFPIFGVCLLIVLIPITLLELAICFVQSYVWVLLLALYTVTIYTSH